MDCFTNFCVLVAVYQQRKCSTYHLLGPNLCIVNRSGIHHLSKKLRSLKMFNLYCFQVRWRNCSLPALLPTDPRSHNSITQQLIDCDHEMLPLVLVGYCICIMAGVSCMGNIRLVLHWLNTHKATWAHWVPRPSSVWY